MDTKNVYIHLLKYLSNRNDLLVLTTNLNWELAFEADVLFISKNLKIIEFEIKTSRSDFFKDKKKIRNEILKYDFLDGFKSFIPYYQSKRPNQFFYVCPHGLVSKKEIPNNYGLIEVLSNGQVVMSKRAKILHTNKTDVDFCLSVSRNFTIKQCNHGNI